MPFQSIQVDHTELSWVGHLKYFLVIVDHLTNWVKAMTLLSATTSGVVKVLWITEILDLDLLKIQIQIMGATSQPT
jgi:hypothetical protein